ncbi:DUF7373 family lipoprotein [Nocardia sp. NBC_00403]|uniref:DUF7373 family lipoprotein n=1 Tax=Nocardia sp. NBC_00403 TaxID=2975990 RepID=UPI003FA580B0
MKYRGGLAALVIVVAVASAGCSTSVSGSPEPGLTPVDLPTLKVGAYSPEPTGYDAEISTPGKLRLVEARRMLNYLVHPSDIDSDITVLNDVELFFDGEQMVTSDTFPQQYRPAAVDNNLIAGAYVSRTNGDLRHRKKLIISVLRFPTEAAGRKATEEFDQITNADPGRHPIPIENRPDARTSSADDITAISFVSHGPYVILANAAVPEPNPSSLSSIIGKTIDQQLARLDQQKPTPLDDVLDLPTDPDSIMRRALPKAKDYSDPFIFDHDFGPYEPSGQLHFERNPVEIGKAFEESGVDLVGRRAGIIYRTRDLAAAFHLQNVLVKAGKNDEELAPPPGLPDVRCLKLDSSDPFRSYDELCAVVYGRYVAVVMSKAPYSARSDPALYQRAAAQYAILAKSE